MAKPLATRLLSLPAPCLRLRPLGALLPKPAQQVSPMSIASSHSRRANLASRRPRNVPARRYFSGEKAHSYTFEEIKELSENPQKGTIIIDVREPHELAETGRIPGARSMPLNSNPDAISLPREAFLRRFGFAKPNGHLAEALERDVRDEGPLEHDVKGEDPLEVASDVHRKDTAAGGSVKHVVFYCKSGVRSASAAQQVMQGEGGWPAVQSAHFKGGWTEWAAKGGKVEKVE